MNITWEIFSVVIVMINFVCSQMTEPRGPWRLSFRAYSGHLYTWETATIGHATMWDLFTSPDSYTPSPSSMEPYKSRILQDWNDKRLNVQAVKMSFVSNNREQAFIVFNGFGKTKSTWFSCDNILYASYSDLPDAYIADKVLCPGTTTSGFPFSIQKKTFLDGPCNETTGWTVVADTDLTWSLCSSYAPYDGPEPYFKYSKLTGIANLTAVHPACHNTAKGIKPGRNSKTTDKHAVGCSKAVCWGQSDLYLETADILEIYIQVWDMVFKGIDGIKPVSYPKIRNLTDLWLLDAVENEKDPSVLTLTYSPVKTFKSGMVNNWGLYFIDTVKFSMFDAGIEKAFFVFDGRGTDSVSWFDDTKILYTNYDIHDHLPLEICSIEGDLNRNWQIQKIADLFGCTDNEQLGWMLVKEPRNNGTCTWDIKPGKVKPYFLYNTQPVSANPGTFHSADVMAVFVHGWRLVLKVSAGSSLSPKSSVYSLWTDIGAMNEESSDAKSLEAGTLPFKSPLVDMWDNLTIRAVKVAAYKTGEETFYSVFDGLGNTKTSWFDCSRVLYTSINGFDRNSLTSYTCSIQSAVSSLSFLIGIMPTCNPMSAIGVFAIIDSSTCSSRNDRPQVVYSNQLNTTISDVPTGGANLADTFAIFLDMENCWEDLCKNNSTCDDRGGYFYCFCSGLYYGEVCEDLDGEYLEWTAWTECTVTCGGGSISRIRECVGVEGAGQCHGASEESIICNTDPCPINGSFSMWTYWSSCTEECGTGVRNRSRDCDNPAPQFGGLDCVGDNNEEELCNTHNCPIDGAWTDWTAWTTCTVTCSGGEHERSRDCSNPLPQYGGNNCTGETLEVEICNNDTCPPVHGGWSTWPNWTTCPVSCGKEAALLSRSRTCSDPEPEWGGDYCVGESTDKQYCNNFHCPINGGWGNWSEWSACIILESMECGNGLTYRNRACDNPAPLFGGIRCPGNSTEADICIIPCTSIECDSENPSECELVYRNTGSPSYSVIDCQLWTILLIWTSITHASLILVKIF